nr:MAG TPA: hypothetical protein [Caudoviricetes sp.]
MIRLSPFETQGEASYFYAAILVFWALTTETMCVD